MLAIRAGARFQLASGKDTSNEKHQVGASSWFGANTAALEEICSELSSAPAAHRPQRQAVGEAPRAAPVKRAHPKDLRGVLPRRALIFEIPEHQQLPNERTDGGRRRLRPVLGEGRQDDMQFEHSIQTNDETEEIGNSTLGQLRRQREQLEQSADLAGDTRRVIAVCRARGGRSKAIAWKAPA